MDYTNTNCISLSNGNPSTRTYEVEFNNNTKVLVNEVDLSKAANEFGGIKTLAVSDVKIYSRPVVYNSWPYVLTNTNGTGASNV